MTIATIHLSFRKKKKNNKKIQSDPRSLVVLNADIIVYLSERKSLMPCGSVKTMPFVCKPGIGTIKMSHPAGCFLNKSPQIVVARIIVPHNFTERYRHHQWRSVAQTQGGAKLSIQQSYLCLFSGGAWPKHLIQFLKRRRFSSSSPTSDSS